MRLHEVVEAYIAFKRALGVHLESEARVLRAFCRSLQVIPTTVDKDDAHHQTQEKQCQRHEPGETWECHAIKIPPLLTRETECV